MKINGTDTERTNGKMGILILENMLITKEKERAPITLLMTDHR